VRGERDDSGGLPGQLPWCRRLGCAVPSVQRGRQALAYPVRVGKEWSVDRNDDNTHIVTVLAVGPDPTPLVPR
jgi:hypothetical protein